MSKTPSSRHVQLPKEPTRRQLSRAEREARQSRTVWLVFGGVIAVLVLVLAFGWLRENVLLQNEPVANVNGELISTRTFQNRVRLARAQIIQQRDRSLALGDQTTAGQYQQQLDDAQGLGAQVLQELVDEVLLKQAAPEFNVSVSPEEVQTFIEEDLNYYRNPPTPAPTRTPRPTPTVTEPITQTPTPTITPFPTATPVSAEGFQQLYKDQLSYLATLGFTEQEFRQIIETRLIGEKVRAAIASTVPTTTEQVQFRYIRIDAADVQTATQIINRDGFDTVYQEVLSGTFPITTVQASETFDWVPKDAISQTSEFGPTLADELFNAVISQTTFIGVNQAGTASYVVQLTGKEVRPLSSSFLQDAQTKAVDAWLEQRRSPTFYLNWQDRVPTTPK
jgi:hypothetical protein